jgi:hypothetical protein
VFTQAALPRHVLPNHKHHPALRSRRGFLFSLSLLRFASMIRLRGSFYNGFGIP